MAEWGALSSVLKCPTKRSIEFNEMTTKHTPFLWPGREVHRETATVDDSGVETEFRGTERFSVVRRIGGGGMGVVFEVLDRERGCAVALKVLRRLKPSAIQLFKTEFRALQDIAHPNLVSLGELFDQDGQWFFTMELVEGLDFLSFVRGHLFAEEMQPNSVVTQAGRKNEQGDSSFVAAVAEGRRTPLSEVRLRSGVRQLCQGLLALHRAHQVHRDVKPSNILVTSENRVVLLDFGLVADWRQTAEKGLFGTLSYMAPEQAEGSISPAADWYSVGVILYRALTGTLPFPGHEPDVLRAKREMTPVPPSLVVESVPADLESLCMELLRPKPEERPAGPEILRRLAGKTVAGKWSSGPEFAAPSSAPFVGRHREMEEIRGSLESSKAGVGTAVFIEGESGVGKSALVRRCLETFDDVLVLEARCYERESIRYKGVDGLVDALTRHLLELPPSEVQAIAPVRAYLLSQVFPVLGRMGAFATQPKLPLPEMDAVRLRSQTFAAFRELLWRLAERGPLVLAIDDLQWADPDSVLLLSEALKGPDAPPLLLLATLRLSSQSRAVLAALDGKILAECRRFHLEPLAPEDARKLAKALTEEDESSLAEDIAREAGGHPLFISELTHALHREGRRQRRRNLSLDEALWARMGQLPQTARAILSATAVAGEPTEQSVIAEAVGATSFADFSGAVSELRAAGFVRTSGIRPSNTIEPYHDRVREAVTAHLDASSQSSLNENLALVLEGREGTSPERLAILWREAGNGLKAAMYASTAGERAAASLAFDKAATLFRMALELSPDSSALPKLRLQLAQALVNLGRSVDAAEMYLSAAAQLPPDEALDARRRAADQLLRSGRIDEGFEVLRDVLKAVNISLPKSLPATIVSLLYRRCQLALRGMNFEVNPTVESTPQEQQRMDVCWSIAVGLSLVDYVRGAVFQTQALLLALRAGEPERVIVALAFEAIYREAEGRRSRIAGGKTLQAAEQLARTYSTPYAQAWLKMARGFGDVQRGDNARSFESLKEAARLFRTHCPGAVWELEFSEFFSVWCLKLMGRYKEMKKWVQQSLDELRVRGNLRAALQIRTTFGHLCHLADDRQDLAKAELATAIQEWNRPGFDLQHAYHYIAMAEVALYAGELVEGNTFDDLWNAYDRSMFSRSEFVDVWFSDMRARCMLAVAARRGPQWQKFLEMGKRFTERTAKGNIALGRANSAFLFAQVEALRGRRPSTIERLKEAIREYETADMALHAGAAKCRLGEYVGPDEGAGFLEDGLSQLKQQSIAAPQRMVRLLSPGFETEF